MSEKLKIITELALLDKKKTHLAHTRKFAEDYLNDVKSTQISVEASIMALERKLKQGDSLCKVKIRKNISLK